MQNYHRHTCYSNIFTPDSAASNEEYAKRAVELGHKVLSSIEHGWQGYYFQTYELAKKYNLKCVIGAEAYWVKNRLEKDNSNHHIILLAKNNNGREALNDILSEANITGYYYKPRVDLDLILSLPADDIFITSACIAFSGYEDIDDIILKFHKHFKKNFMLEVQYHNTDPQKKWNEHLLSLSDKYKIEIIVGLDSHYINEKDSWKRDNILNAKGMHYEDENDWYMDYPDDDIVIQRFKDQGILSSNQIKQAMNNTDICLSFEDYDNVSIFNKDIKLPTLYPEKTQEEKNKKYGVLITKKFKEFMKNLPPESYDERLEGIRMEVQTYKDTGMVDYPLLDYEIVKDAIEHGGLITDTGRGSAVGYWTNTLCGFSKVDRFTAAIKLYPERFISTTRILETHSLPDIDLNTGTPEIFEEAQVRVLGEDHVAPMIAFGTLKKKSAFKMYARAKDMDFSLANIISEQIAQYEEAVKYAEDEEKDLIDIYDYVDEQYREYIERSEEYQGIIADKKKAPSAYLLYQGNIRKEIGLIKCKSEASKKEYITCVIDGRIAEDYKFLKNDILKVDVVLLIDKVFKRIGIPHFDVNTLLSYIKKDKKVWDLYANGYTIGVNQVEQVGSRHKCMRYKPTNISELSAFIAAIRPGFKSMYDRFEKREDFRWGIDALDNLLRTEELPVSFIFFQEQCMSILNYAGFPIDQCYGIIKAIAKKHPEKVKPLKSQFLAGFKKHILEDENISDRLADEYSDKVWTVVNDNCGYSFNSSHAFCMALDSAYQAWQKVHYPYEFYEVNLQHFTDKGKKDKVAALKAEMKKAFNITEGDFKFRVDNRKFNADKEHHCIIPMLSSIKGIGNKVAQDLYDLRDNKYPRFTLLLKDIKEKTSCNKAHLEMLIKLDYFSEFGEINLLLKTVKLFNRFDGAKVLKKEKVTDIPEYILNKYCKETEKQWKVQESRALLDEVIFHIKDKIPKCKVSDRIKWELEFLGYINLTVPNTKDNYYYVQKMYDNKVSLYCIKTGETSLIKFRKKDFMANPFMEEQIIKVKEIRQEKKWKLLKDDQGNEILDSSGKKQWIRLDEYEDILSSWIVLKKS